jgi:hypothetical protein
MSAGLFEAARLSKEGFGTVEDILDMGADKVIELLHFVRYRSEFDETYSVLNKKETT